MNSIRWKCDGLSERAVEEWFSTYIEGSNMSKTYTTRMEVRSKY